MTTAFLNCSQWCQ